MAEVDRTAKFKIERLAKMVPLRSPQCRQGTHAWCPGVVEVMIGGEVERRPRDGGFWAKPDSIQSPCGCDCHRSK